MSTNFAFDEMSLEEDSSQVNLIQEEVVSNNPYSNLKPYFDELTSIMRDNCTEEDMLHIKNFFQERIGFFKMKSITRPKGEKLIQKGQLVSSTTATSKRRKAHGTSHY